MGGEPPAEPIMTVADVADVAVPHQLRGQPIVDAGALLRAPLEDDAVFLHRFTQCQAFGQRDAERLLAVHVLPAARRLDANQRMPAFPGGDDHGIDVRPRQQLAKIGMRGAFRIAILLIDRALSAFEGLRTDIGDGEDPDVRHLEESANVAAAHPPDADVPDRDAIARGSRL